MHLAESDRKSTRLNSSHLGMSYAVFCLRSEEHTSELQSLRHLVCRLLLEKKKKILQIVVQVLMTDRSLVGSHQPPVEQGDHLVNPWHQFFFNDTATTEIYTLSLHDALPIWRALRRRAQAWGRHGPAGDHP